MSIQEMKIPEMTVIASRKGFFWHGNNTKGIQVFDASEKLIACFKTRLKALRWMLTQ